MAGARGPGAGRRGPVTHASLSRYEQQQPGNGPSRRGRGWAPNVTHMVPLGAHTLRGAPEGAAIVTSLLLFCAGV
jgi:hypothetical protein